MTAGHAAIDKEASRLAMLRELMVLDSAPEPLFDSIARLASEVCGVPVGLLSLVDQERQWFKAKYGVTAAVDETPRDIAFCAHAIGGDAVFEVPDALLDERFADNPLVTGEMDIRFYAGAPLIVENGIAPAERVGTLCVIDHAPHRLDPAQATMLRSLAAITSQALAMRRDLIDRSLSVRSRYEEAIARSEASHRALVEKQLEIVSLARADGELVYVNPAYARFFGRAPEALVGSNLFDGVDAADRPAVQQLMAEVFESGESRSSDNRMALADGEERWVAWTNSVLRDADGQALLHSVGRDVTRQKQAEQALRASQSFLHRTGRVAGVGGWELDLLTQSVIWSDETRRIHDVGPDYVPTLEGAAMFYPPEARPAIEAAVQRAFCNDEGYDLELPFTTATGRRGWVRAAGAVEFENGMPVRMIGALQDITERKRLEARLAESERFVREITDHLPVRIAYYDGDKRFRFANRARCEPFGLAREQILGRTRAELSTPGSDPSVEARIDAALAGAPQHYEFDETVDGTTRRIEARLVPDVAESGAVRGVFATGIDITERSAAERALRLLTTIFDNSSDYVVQTDPSGAILYLNPAARRALELAPDAAVGELNAGDFHTPATNRQFAREIAPAVRANGLWVGETTVYDGQRREIPVSHMVIAHHDAAGRLEYYSAVMRNIAADVEAKRQLQRQTAILRSVSEAIPAIVAIVGADGRYRFVNGAFERWQGAKRTSIVGHTMMEVMGRIDYERSRPWIERAMAGETVKFEREYPSREGPAHLGISYVPLWEESGAVDGFVAVAQDITQHKQEEVRLLRLTQRDALTGLLNRAGFEEYLEARLQDGFGASIAVLYIDLDHFKPVNDQHGHPVGDQLLQRFAQRLAGLVRPTDAVARLGGDEFAVVLTGLREGANADRVAEKVLAAAQEPFELEGLRLTIGASVGVAFRADMSLGWRELVARADAMMYRAKASGRGRHASTARAA